MLSGSHSSKRLFAPAPATGITKPHSLALRTAQGRWPGVRHVGFGDLFLTDVRAYRETLLDSLGWVGLFPLWGGARFEYCDVLLAPGAPVAAAPTAG